MENNKIKTIDRRMIYLLCFLIPLSVMIACMVCYGVEPFGDNSFVIIDGLHQYMPFFSVLYDKLRGGENLFYTFRIGLGVNFLSLFSYYLSSPLNVFILLFKKSQLNMAVSLLIVLKISLSGLTAGVYFSHKTRQPDLSVVAAACIYALNSYMVGYSWNVMWLDAILIFPIIMMGIDRLIEKRDGRLYCIALFYALFCNYYIAFMICIFCVIWYLLYPFRNYEQFFLRGCVFTAYSFLAAGMAAVILLPAYLGIRQTASGNEMTLPHHGWQTGFADLLTRQFDMSAPISHDNFDGNINLYFGAAAVFTIFLYIFNKEIRWIQKLKMILLLAFLYVSFNEDILNFIWHGFHNQYGIPNRFSFLFGFVITGMFVEVLEHRECIRNWHTVLSTAACVGLLYVSRSFAKEPLEDVMYGVAGIMFVFYGTILLLMTIDRNRKLWYVRILSLAAVIEICASAVAGFDSIGQIHVSKFFSGTEDMEQAAAQMEDGSFFRSELADSKIVDESTWYPLRGVSLFGSTAMDHTVKIMDNLGFYTGCNEYLYKGATPLTNMMLDVRYLYFHPEDTLRTEFEYRKSFGNFSLYENPVKGLSVGYVIDDDIEQWYYDSAYPFRVLNDFSYQGYSYDNIFQTLDIPEPVTRGCRVEKTNDGEYHFFYNETNDDNIVFTLPMKEKVKHLYLFYDGTQVDNAQIAVDGENVIAGDKDSTMLYAGEVGKDSVVTVRFRLKGETEDGYIRLSAASFDKDQFTRLADTMTSQAFQVSKWSCNHLEGRVSSGERQILFFSIPYDEGWKILADNKMVRPGRIGNAFLAVPLEKGVHEVSLTYVPPGFDAGWKISLICLMGLVIICITTPFIRKRRRLAALRRVKKAKKKREECEAAETDTPSEQTP